MAQIYSFLKQWESSVSTAANQNTLLWHKSKPPSQIFLPNLAPVFYHDSMESLIDLAWVADNGNNISYHLEASLWHYFLGWSSLERFLIVKRLFFITQISIWRPKLLWNRLDDVIDEVWSHLWRHQLPENFDALRVTEAPHQNEAETKRELASIHWTVYKLVNTSLCFTHL